MISLDQFHSFVVFCKFIQYGTMSSVLFMLSNNSAIHLQQSFNNLFWPTIAEIKPTIIYIFTPGVDVF